MIKKARRTVCIFCRNQRNEKAYQQTGAGSRPAENAGATGDTGRTGITVYTRKRRRGHFPYIIGLLEIGVRLYFEEY